MNPPPPFNESRSGLCGDYHPQLSLAKVFLWEGFVGINLTAPKVQEDFTLD